MNRRKLFFVVLLGAALVWYVGGRILRYERGVMLITAIKSGKPDKALELLRAGADPEAQSYTEEWSPRDYFNAMIHGYAYSRYSISALMHAAIAGQTDVVKELIHRGANINEANSNGSPISWAAQYDRVAVVRTLLENGAELRADSFPARKVLVFAAQRGYADVLSSVVSRLKGTPSERQSALDETLASLAAWDRVDGMRLLVAHGANVNGSGNLCPLVSAAYNGRLKSVRYLISAGADVNKRFDGMIKGETPLMAAVNKSRPEIVRCLLDAKADPNLKDIKGNTALHRAIELGQTSIQKMLLQAGANPTVRNLDGKIPEDMALKPGQNPRAVPGMMHQGGFQ